MGRGTWYYSLGVFLEIVDVFVRSETYLLGGAIDGSKANGIIRDPKLELESSCFTFDLVPLSYESVDVVVGENWLLRHRISYGISTKSDADLQRLVSFDVFRKARGLDDCRSCKVRVGSNGNLLWEASVLLGRKKVKEEKMYVKFSTQRGSGAKREATLDVEGSNGEFDFEHVPFEKRANVVLYRGVDDGVKPRMSSSRYTMIRSGFGKGMLVE
ncbi:hypothetical protein Tco_0214136 [Tanacetum coccineum]